MQIDESLLSSENIGDTLIAKTKIDNLKKKSMSEKVVNVTQDTNKTWQTRYNKSNDMKEQIQKEDDILYAEHEERMKNWKGKINFLIFLESFFESEQNSIKMNISFKNNLVAGGPKFNTFKELPNLNKILLENLEKLNYNRMTVIQRAIIPLVLAGKDVMGFSHTGTGKTLSFLLPVFNKMMAEGPPDIESKKIF